MQGASRAPREGVRVAHLFAHDRLFLQRHVFERRQQDRNVLGPANELGELAELFREHEHHLVLILDRLCRRAPTEKKNGHGAAAATHL